MRHDLVIAIRIVCLAKLLLATCLLYRWQLGTERQPSVFDTVYAQCIVILVSLCYYCVLRLCLAACNPPKRPKHRRFTFVPRDADGNYVDLQGMSVTDVVHGAPRLTIQNVWVLVYGVGFILFVSGYCMLGLNQLCLACFGLGMGTLALDELVCPRCTMTKLYASVRAAALVTSVVSLLLVSAELLGEEITAFTSTLDFYSFGFGFCLPTVSHFLMIAVRDSRHYSLGSVLEVCEFGLPFTAFLGIFHLSVAYGQRFQMSGNTPPYEPILRTDGPFLLFFGLAPILVCPCLVAFVVCVLEGSSIDPLLATTLTLCVYYVLEKPASSIGVYGTACCAVAIGLRVAGEYRLQLGLHPLSESPYLTREAVLERQRRQREEDIEWEERTRQAEELTRELSTQEDTA